MDRAKEYFNCTDGERAVFEAAIKLAMVYHQFVGVPVTAASVRSLERAIEEAVLVQPWVVSVRARINRAALGRAAGRYGYRSLDGKMLTVEVVTRYGAARARCAMKFVERMNYPLMFIRDVKTAGKRKPRR